MQQSQRSAPTASQQALRDAEADDAAGDRLVVVSNRQPYRHYYDSSGEVAVDRPMGGLTAGLDPVVQRVGGKWIAWGDGEADYEVADSDDCVAVPPENPEYTLQRVRLSADRVRGYYDGFANQVLWPVCHSLPGKLSHDDGDWEDYAAVNEQFAAAVLDHIDDDSTVWFQDYHFALAPGMVAAERPEATVMQFWHTPWPTPDVFRTAPHHKAVLRGLLGNDLLGFHVPRYRANFLRCVEEFLDHPVVDWDAGRVLQGERSTRVETFPLGVNAERFDRTSRQADGSFWNEFRQDHGIDADTQVALGVDRLDYTKGIPERLEALAHLWQHHPEWREELTYVQKAAESRQRIPAYQRLQNDVETRIETLNDRFGTPDWTPVLYTTENYPHEELCSLYRHSDLALVAPVRDGMNLVAQEYVAAQVDCDGVLVLGDMAGASERLGEDAVGVNPHDTAGFAEAIEDALTMDDIERRDRMHALRDEVSTADLSAWLDAVFERAAVVRRQG